MEPRVHNCPHCVCLPPTVVRDVGDMGPINTNAPFYSLVMAISKISHEKEKPTDG